MKADSAAVLVGQLARAGAGASVPVEVLREALPIVLKLAGARSALVIQPRADGTNIAVAAGEALDAGTLTLDLAEHTSRLAELPVPEAWASAGVTQAAARALAGDFGVVVLAWGPAARAEAPWLDTALAVLDAELARAQAAERLADLTARVDNAQQLANMGDYDWHIATDTNRWSDQLYRIYGHEPQSFNASYDRFLSQIHPEDRERITGIHQHAYATAEPYEMIERIVRPDGQVRYLASNGQVVRDDTDTPVRMRGTCIDITDRVLAEQAREHSAARFRSLVESSPDAIVVIDSFGKIVQANGHASELLGADPAGRAMAEVMTWPMLAGDAVAALGLDGRPLQLDVSTAKLSHLEDETLVAAFLRDATARLQGEAVAARLREAEIRRQQALEINDNVVQGLTVAVMTMQGGDIGASASCVEQTLEAARRMMNEWLQPLGGGSLQPGDLIRSVHSTLEQRPTATSARSAAHRR